MWKIAVPGIADVLEARQKRIKDNLDKATKAKQEAEETLSNYELSIKEARTKAEKINVISAKKLAKEVEANEAKVSEELSLKITECEAEIQDAINSAMETIRENAIEIAGEAVFRLTEQTPDSKKLISALDRSLKALG
jgi:F-type H+-transporting ATPase subunit b